MFHIRKEGGPVKTGFNFYPWSERKYSIGFIFKLGKIDWWFRIAPHVGVIYIGDIKIKYKLWFGKYAKYN
ncbi:MAG: hypothetical protein KGL35_28780 [Bradyrhizobium sp.]|nr:hypothetical protein [Bradyrhizobium sp.]